MKKKVSTFLIAFVFLFATQPVFAETNSDVEIEYLPDGSYYITTIEEVPDSDSENSALSRATTTTTRAKTKQYCNASGNVMWYVKVTGTFTYGNGSATCTKSTASAEAYGKTWKIISKSASKSGSSASAKATARQYVDGIPAITKNKSVTLTCSPTGTFS